MGSKGNPHQFQQLLNVSYSDEIDLFHAKISNQQVLLVRQHRSLHCFRLEPYGSEWKVLWSRERFFDEKRREFRTSFFVDESGWILVKNRQGLQFYRMEGNDLTLQHYSTDGRYRDMYGWNDSSTVFLMGHLYADVTAIGVLTRNKRGVIKFEQMMESVVLKGGTQPLWQLYDPLNLPDTWKLNTTWLGLATTDGNQQVAVIERTVDAITVYKLDQNYVPQIVARTENVPFVPYGEDRILFGNISDNNDFSDMLHLNSSGMFLYKREQVYNKYQPVSQNSQLVVGWEKKHWDSASLIDVDGDGRDEMWLSGPEGIVSFRMSKVGFECISSDFEYNEDVRYARMVQVIPDRSHKTRAIAVSGRQMISFLLASSKNSTCEIKENGITVQPGPTGGKHLQSIFALNAHTGPLVHASLGEQIDTSLLFEPINPMNGNLAFGIPLLMVGRLFALSTVKFITYQESSNVSSTMGNGWSLQIDCVYIDRRNSIFPEEHRYYLIKDGSSFLLTNKKTANSSANDQIVTFAIESNDQMTVTFNRALDQWLVEDGNGESFIYGTYGDKSFVKMDNGIEDWPFQIKRSEVNTRYSSVWYMIRHFDRAGQWLEYSYVKETQTDDYQLEAISTSSGASMILSYSNLFNKMLLTSFTIRTSRYIQAATLQYMEQGEMLRLKRISQQSNVVLEFSYEGPGGAMSEIIYPNGLVAKFEYSSIEIDRDVLMNHFITNSHPRTAYGPGYLLIGDITNQAQVRLRITDTLGSDTVALAGGHIPMLGKLPVVDYEMFTGESFFAILLHHKGTQPELCLFQTQAGIWQAIPTYIKLPKNTSVYTGHNLLAIQKHRITVIEQDNGKWKALRPIDVEESSLKHYFSHGFLTYNDQQLRMYVRRDGKWEPSVLMFPSELLANSTAVFDRFDHPEEIVRNLQQGIKLDALRMFHNVVVFRSLHLEGSKLYARLHLLHLNWKHEISRQTVVDILIEDLATYTFNPPEAEGNVFVFGYRVENGKYRLKVINHRGTIMDEIEKIKEQIEQDILKHPNAPEAEKQRYRKESHEKLNGELEDLYRNITAQIPLAIDPSKFGVIVNDAHIIAASHKVLFDGIDWTTERIPQEELTLDSIAINLGPSYQLVKTHRNATFDLIGPNNVTVFNTDTNNATELHIRYPTFMAVQMNGSAVQLFDFQRGELTSLPAEELLDTNSNQLAIISTTNDGKNVFVRSMDSFAITRQNVVWRHEFVDSRKRKLINYYEFNAQSAKPYEGEFLMGDVKITPANMDGRYGWFKVHYNFANSTLSTKSVYNAAGEFVKLVDPASEDVAKTIDPDGVLTARDGKTIVADFRPFRMSEEVVSYYGFEPYEQNLVGNGGRWKWTDGVIRNEHGNHFLHLTRSKFIGATFEPKTQFHSLIISCWLRGSADQQDIGNSLSVQYNGNIINGSAAFSTNGWTYVEIVVEKTSRFDVKISPGTNSFLDVDHVRVFPAELELNVHIYDTVLAIERSTLHASGLLSHRLHDTFGNEIGRINEQGSIEHLSILSRRKNSRIEMSPTMRKILEPVEQNIYYGQFQHTPDTAVLRFRYSGTSHSGDIRIEMAAIPFRIEIFEDQAVLMERSQRTAIPREGEVVIFCSNTHYSVWIDGQLKIENFTNQARFERYQLNGKNAHIWEAMLLYDVSMKVIYLSDFGMPKQILELKEPHTIALQEIVYDELNRPAVKSKWSEIDCTNSSMLFGYRSNFIEKEERFWSTGQMEGTIMQLNNDCAGFPYSRTIYADNPLEEKTVQSVPGKPFAVNGVFAKHFNSKQHIDFLENIFPSTHGFYYKDERYPDQSIYVTVYDRRNLKVADYVRAYHGDHHLTTYKYDANDRLILQLPPAYHEQADTFSRTSPFFEGAYSSEHNELQRSWGTWYEYDPQSGLMTVKRTPDAGNTKYLYTPEGLLRFVVQQNSSNVMYYTYSSVGKLSQRGVVKLDVNDLTTYLPNDSTMPVSSNFLLLNHGDNDVAPLHRHRVERITKVSDDSVLSDLLFFDHHGQLTKSALYANGNDSLTVNYKYRKNLLHEIEYPATVKGKHFRVRYDYDHRGKLTGMSNAATDEKFVTIENNSMGQPRRMLVQPNSPYAYQRTFQYNQPGYLTKIEDPYLSEMIDYIGSGYGGRPIGDGTVQATRFNATWHVNSKITHLKLKPSHLGKGRRSKFCYDALVSAGYLDSQGKPLKSFYPLLDLRLPIVCRLGTYGNQIAATINAQGFPQVYGHRYDYGNHRQLIRAKYFQSSAEEKFNPLRRETFAEIEGVSVENSEDIWQKLRNAGYLHSDCSTNREMDCHGLSGKSIFQPAIASHPNAVTLSSLLVRVITQRKNLSKTLFDQLCAGWYQDDISEAVSNICNATWTMLSDAGFVGAKSNFGMAALNQELHEVLRAYTPHLPEIIDVLYHKFATALGYSSADVQSYAMDANGNHRHFYTGFRRYRLEYVKNTNKIANVYRTNFAAQSGLEEVRFPVEHNEDGSVIRATHKGIERIVYDVLTNRATEITLIDGRQIKLDYNVRGHRLYKHVYDRTGKLIRKKYYIRDLQGKPLVEYEAVYTGNEAESNTLSNVRSTVFLYAGDRLVGFLRNNQFYTVALDHEGSVRLVIKNGEIVAAYDYLPYGELLRSYGVDRDSELDFRFTGKEWDEETNLYDFHARLYDPELGRFLQMDPKEQYASPYLYAGNSPVSVVDPDGQFAFLVVALLAVGGAYIGASAANNSWNPAKWELKKALLGGLVGGVIGGLAPFGIAGSVTFLSGYIGTVAAVGVVTATSIGFAYISLADANGSWDPSKWDWTQPGTWNALFIGALTGATLFNAIGGIQKAYIGLTGLSRTAFVIVTTGTTGGFLLYSGSKANDGSLRFWEWDWSNPSTVWGAIEGASFGLSVSPKLNSVTQQVAARVEKLKEIGKAIKVNDFKSLGTLLKDEVKAWKQIYTNVITGDTVQDAINAGKAAGRPAGTILLDKIPPEAMKVIDEILTIEKLFLQFKKKKQKRNIAYNNVTLSFPRPETGKINYSLRQLEYVNNCPQDELLVVSSANKISHWLNRIIESIFENTNESGSKQDDFPSTITLFTSRKKSSRKSYQVSNCFHTLSEDKLSGIVCYEKYGLSYIFPHNTSNVISKTEDHYASCYPIEYEGITSATCTGTHSSYVFMPHSRGINYLDYLNGSLTLLLVAPTITKQVTSFISNLLFKKPKQHQQLVSKQEQANIDRKFSELQQTVKEYRQFADNEMYCSWLENVFQDIEDDTKMFQSDSNPTSTIYHQLIDRIHAFHDELQESKQVMSFNGSTNKLCSSNIVDLKNDRLKLHSAEALAMPLNNFASTSVSTADKRII
uniref:Tox-SGS domain-containing protein n=1 Tax=Anopheles funestus TaxID=62324 RepID=A0A182RR88_ANOFN